MNKKRIVSMALAMVLAVGAGIGGTLAYLQETTEKKPVINTFAATTLINGEFNLKEHEVVDANNDGAYSQDEVLMDSLLPKRGQPGNKYNVVPGVDLPKDPFVTVETKAKAYLFVEVINGDPTHLLEQEKDDGLITYRIDSANWTATDLTPAHQGGKIYVYTNETNTDLIEGNRTLKVAKHENTDGNMDILDQDKVFVGKDANAHVTALDANSKLTFNGYLVQSAGFKNYTAAWTASGYGKNAPVTPVAG